MSKLEKTNNKQSENYSSLLSVSTKSKEKKLNRTALPTKNHKRRKRKNLIRKRQTSKAIESRKQHIKNLSDKELTIEQINLLSRGLNFIPTPVTKENQIRRQLIKDFDKFARRMRLQYIYHDKKTEPHPFHVKSSWIPPAQPSVALESYLEEVKLQLAEITFYKSRQRNYNRHYE